MKIPFLVVASLGFAAVGWAQNSSTPTPFPGGPAIQLRAPDMARWTVTYNPKKGGNPEEGESASSEKSNSPAFKEKVSVVKTKPIIFERVLKANGPQRDKWSINGVTFSLTPPEKKYAVYDSPTKLGSDFYSDFSKTDFPGFEWVSEKNYVDVKKVLGRECLLYQQVGEGAGPNTVAYVDYRTRLPVLFQKKGDVRLYQFEAAPTTPLILPPDAQVEVASRAKAKAAAEAAAKRYGQ